MPVDGVIQDPGGFGETGDGGRANPYFTARARPDALEHMRAAGYFLTYEPAGRGTAATSRRAR